MRRLRLRLRRRFLPLLELLLELPLADFLAGAIWVNFAISCNLLRFGWFTLRPLYWLPSIKRTLQGNEKGLTR